MNRTVINMSDLKQKFLANNINEWQKIYEYLYENYGMYFNARIELTKEWKIIRIKMDGDNYHTWNLLYNDGSVSLFRHFDLLEPKSFLFTQKFEEIFN